MAILLIIISILLWLASGAALFRRILLAPALSYLGLLALSFAERDDAPLLPINNTILIGWLCMTLVVMLATLMQNPAVTQQRRGVGYMLAGAIVGLAIGLLGFTFTSTPAMLYATMVIATAAGTFFGFLLFSNTPDGRAVGFSSGRFFTYLMAKGFPTAITVMQAGVVLVILIARNLSRLAG